MEKGGARILHLKDIFEQMESTSETLESTDHLKVLRLPNYYTQGRRGEECEDKEEEMISVMRSVQLLLN